MNISVLISKFTTDELLSLKKIIDRSLMSRLNELGTKTIYLDISARAHNVLIHNQISTLEELSQMTTKEFLRLENTGKKTLIEMTEVLSAYGMRWKNQV